MRTDRDTVLIALALSPVAFMVYAVYEWRVTGSFPLWLFSWAAPNVALPALPDVAIPAPAVTLWHQVLSNDVAIGLGLGIGMLAGILAIGTVADAVRAFSRLLHRGEVAMAEQVTELEFPDVRPAETYFVS